MLLARTITGPLEGQNVDVQWGAASQSRRGLGPAVPPRAPAPPLRGPLSLPGSRAAGLARPPPPLHAPGSPSCLCILGGRRHPTRAGHKSVSTTEARPTRRGHRVLHALSGHAALASGGQGLWPRWPRGPVTRDPLPWAPRDAPLGRREGPGGPQTQHPPRHARPCSP